MSANVYDAPADIDQKIAFLARVTSENQSNPKYEGLIKFLWVNGHVSPFDMVNVTFEINTQKDIGIQLLRHQTLKPQEWSQRYADCSGLRSELRECRLQDTKDRQNSLYTDDESVIEEWFNMQTEVQNLCFEHYEKALSLGIAKETARALLPIGLTDTKMYFNASIRSWLFYCASRCHKTTQKEHRKIAQKILKDLGEIAPFTTKTFIDVYMNGGEHIFEESHENRQNIPNNVKKG